MLVLGLCTVIPIGWLTFWRLYLVSLQVWDLIDRHSRDVQHAWDILGLLASTLCATATVAWL